MNYPHVAYDGHIFSLIEPFTMDNKLITSFSADYSPEFRRTYIEVKLHGGEMFSLRYDYLDVELERVCDEQYRVYFASENGWIRQECRHFLSRRNEYRNYCDHLMRDIEAQCSLYRRGYNMGALSVFKEKCALQDRELDCTDVRTTYMSANEYAILHDGYSRYNLGLDANDPPRTTIDNVFVSGRSYRGQEKTIIHMYNYTPVYKKHYLEGEDEVTTLLLGAEIEVDCGGESSEHAKAVLKIMNGEDTWDSEDNIFCVHDGSLTEKGGFTSSGLEFPTQPGSLAWHKTLPYEKMFEYLDKHGYKAHDTKTCGLHIHINRSFFGDKEAECIGKLMYIVEKFNDEFSAIGRRSCHYSKMLGYNGEKCKELYQKGYTVRDKYNAINLLHQDTIEIRAFKGTLKYSTYINTLEFVEKLAQFVKTHTEEEVEKMNWAELYATFSKDLRKYYDERAEIEAKKKADEAKEASERLTSYIGNGYGVINADRIMSSSISFHPTTVTATDSTGNVIMSFRNGSNITFDTRAYDVTPTEAEPVEPTYVRYSMPTGYITLNNSIINPNAFRQMQADVDVDISDRINNSLSETLFSMFMNSGEEIREKTDEDKLKDLKKKLKKERNYMSIRALNKEIKQLQKKIKQNKKRNSRS